MVEIDYTTISVKRDIYKKLLQKQFQMKQKTDSKITMNDVIEDLYSNQQSR